MQEAVPFNLGDVEKAEHATVEALSAMTDLIRNISNPSERGALIAQQLVLLERIQEERCASRRYHSRQSTSAMHLVAAHVRQINLEIEELHRRRAILAQ